jgi:putative SOS response-associated peptidase YedK
MCGRFTLRTSTPVLLREFRLDTAPPLVPRYNIAPTQSIAVVRQPIGEPRELVMLHWGLIPPWSQDPSMGSRMINARSETVATKRSFRKAFRQRRCLVPADGYYEWQTLGARKQPYWIRMQDDRPFGFAGLWESWRGHGQLTGALESCTILTTNANELTRPIHDRMPVILDSACWDEWLDPQNHDVARLQRLLTPTNSDLMRVDPVSTHVNNPRHEDAACIELQHGSF